MQSCGRRYCLAAPVLLAALTSAFHVPFVPRAQHMARTAQHAWGVPVTKVGAALPRASPVLFSSLYEEEGSQTEVDDEMADGVSIKTLVDHEEDAAFIAQNIQQWLDDEWIPQECHKTIGDKCAEIYIESRRDNVNDLTQILLSVGTAFEEVDMGDAFVDAWSVANKVSDLLLERMGREVCCAVEPLTEQQQAIKEGNSCVDEAVVAKPAEKGRQLLIPELPPYFFTQEDLIATSDWFMDEFNRFDFLRKFLDGHDGTWREANLVMAILLGYNFDEYGNVDLTHQHERFRDHSYPPDFEKNEKMRDYLETVLAEDEAEDEDKMQALEEFIEVMVGKAWYHQMMRSGNVDFSCRSSVVKWIYEYDFVSDFAKLDSVKRIQDVKAKLESRKEKPAARFFY